MTAPTNRDGPTVTGDELREDLLSLGLEGDDVVVHASLSSLGWVDGGADAVVDALASAVGETGTVAVPTFTPESARLRPFDAATTPSETGAVTEALRTRPDAVRSAHPTHSVAALGPAAEALTANHERERSLGADSPLHRLAKRGGKILLLGVGTDRNSTLHVAEALADLPYKTGSNRVLVRDDAGDARRVETARVGCGRGFVKLDPVASRAGTVTRGSVGAARAQVLCGADAIRLARSVLADHPGFLLCDDPDCWWCPDARRALVDDG